MDEATWVTLKEAGEDAIKRGDYKRAESLFKEALKAIDGGDSGDGRDMRVAYSLDRLADALFYQGRYEETETVLNRALTIKTLVNGPYHADVTDTLNGLACLYYERHEYDKAEPICLKILKIYETTRGLDHPDVGNISNILALIYNSQERFAEAEPLYKRALEITGRRLGIQHPVVINVLENYAALLHKMGRDDEAEYLKTCAMGRISGVFRALQVKQGTKD